MLENSSRVVIIGEGPVALLTALELQQAGAVVTLIVYPVKPAAAFNPTMALMGGDEVIPPLLHQSHSLWRSASERLALPNLVSDAPLMDLAFSEPHEAKLHQEALMDALGGEHITYRKEIPTFLQKNVLGFKSWPNSTFFAENLLSSLQAAVDKSPIQQLQVTPHKAQWAEGDKPLLIIDGGGEIYCDYLLLASAEACNLLLPNLSANVPLRPARGHSFTLMAPLPADFPTLLIRLKRGHLFVVPRPQKDGAQVYYDALLEPLQATRKPEPDPALLTEIAQQVTDVIPLFKDAKPENPTTQIHWLTPDFLPVLGAWPSHPALVVATGLMSRDVMLAAGIARALTKVITEQTAHGFSNAFIPNRFASGLWEKTASPGSLAGIESPPKIIEMPKVEAEYMTNVQMIEKPKAQFADKVQSTEKEIIKAEKPLPIMREKGGKPKVQTASVKK